ncbi:MAG: protein kinase domain-containing protein [Thermoanaerobaculia bacterium]
MPAMPLASGTRLGPYEILTPLGAGGMGEVYRARDTRLGRDVAVKILSEELAKDRECLRRFEQEARAASGLSDPHIVAVFDVGRDQEVSFIVTEIVEGTDLRLLAGGTRLPLERIVDIAGQIAAGLSAAHEKGIVHRDLKPENILVSKNGLAKIADFGLAKLASPENEDISQMATAAGDLTRTGTILGTVAYMSPEQARGEKIDFRSDQFSFGTILYELLTGISPFKRPTAMATLMAVVEEHPRSPGESRVALPENLGKIVRRCLAKSAEDRYHSTKDLVRDLAEALQPSAAGVAAAATAPRVLPVPPNPLIGRTREVAAVRAMLLGGGVRLLTLAGPAGIGKTRLALQAANELAADFPGGVEFIALAAVTDPSLIVAAIARALNVGEEPGRLLGDLLCEHLLGRMGGAMLLLLDNFEHLLEGVGTIADLLAKIPKLKILLTSRSLIRISGEHEFPVPPLPVPGAEDPISPGALESVAAVQLFLQRALAVKPSFALTEENAPAVAQICRRLDGLPLAIELAAARIKLLSPAAIRARLETRLDLLTGGPRDLPTRQQTLRAAIDWSFELLSEPEKSLFRRVSVFVGGCTLEAIEAVCNAREDLGVDPLEGVASLCDKSLLLRSEAEGDDARFVQLQTIREYGRGRLEDSGEEDFLRRCHAAYYLVLAEETDARMGGPDGAAAFALLKNEEDNCRSAVEWLALGREPLWGLRLGASLFRFWEKQETVSEGRAQLELLLSLPGAQVRTRERARALLGGAILAHAQRDKRAQETMASESLEIYREIGDRRGCVVALNDLAVGAYLREDYRAAVPLLEEAIRIWEEIGERGLTERTRMNLADSLRSVGETERARDLFEKCLRTFSELGDLDAMAWTQSHLAGMAQDRGERDEAKKLLTQSLSTFERTGDWIGVANCASDLARIAERDGDFDSARFSLRNALAIVRRDGAKRSIARLIDSYAMLAAAEGLASRAICLVGAVEAFRKSHGFPRPRFERVAIEQTVEKAAEGISEQEAETAWRRGRAMSIEEAVEEALAEPPGSSGTLSIRPSMRQ